MVGEMRLHPCAEGGRLQPVLARLGDNGIQLGTCENVRERTLHTAGLPGKILATPDNILAPLRGKSNSHMQLTMQAAKAYLCRWKRPKGQGRDMALRVHWQDR